MKLWSVAALFAKSPEEGTLIQGTWIAPNVENAVAMTVSRFYRDYPDKTDWPCQVTTAGEIPRQQIEAALKGDEKPAAVLHLVRQSYPPDALVSPVAPDLSPAPNEGSRYGTVWPPPATAGRAIVCPNCGPLLWADPHKEGCTLVTPDGAA